MIGELREHDAILLGAIGDPSVPSGVLERGLLLRLRFALDHHVNEAAGSIGQLCNPTECDALAARIGKVPFDVMTSGLDPILFRPKAEVSDDAKVKLVGRIRELGTGEANKFLRDVQKRWPAAWSPRIKQSIDQGVLATAAAPGTATGAP